ncbi:MAG TPA: glutathione S-transferase N-terminal domain-containing protein [Beijerinckiaceae bacterium]|jgi:glutathione S-transferase|nr:glutathione S-transferase N-terminal domain-containing protein [Beijerinckiaceae bacterium]
MKLYYSPGACSLADHIALQEAGLPFESERVDLRAKKTASGADFNAISPKGYVPALVLGDGELLTENAAILDYVASKAPTLGLEGSLGRTRLLEALAFIGSEVHKNFKPFFAGGSDDEKAKAAENITRRTKYLADNFKGNYLSQLPGSNAANCSRSFLTPDHRRDPSWLRYLGCRADALWIRRRFQIVLMEAPRQAVAPRRRVSAPSIA